jgi:DNA polymerase III epsilon subunit-like protein
LRHYIDTETTGFRTWTNSVISLAWIITDDENETIAEFYEECAPDTGKFAWDKSAEPIHGFNEVDQRKKQHPRDLCVNLMSFLDANKISDAIVRYHAKARFDMRMIYAMYFKNMEHNYYHMYKFIQPTGHISTIDLIKNRLKLSSYDLHEVASALGIKFTHHNALSDTQCLVNICKELRI